MLGAGIKTAATLGSAQVPDVIYQNQRSRITNARRRSESPTDMKSVRKAVFPVAGFGTRFLPATKAMPKELLPIVDKPLIQYAAEEAIAAGIDTLIFVTGRNKRAIEDHFDSNRELEAALRAKGKNAQADMVRNILPSGVECIFVRQPEQLGLGHAVLCAERAVGHEPFAVLLADDFLTYEGAGVTADLVKGYEASGRTQLSVIEVNGPDISRYGVVQLGSTNGSVAGLVEKPALEHAPSNLASIGRYVLTPDIFEILRHQAPGAGGEIQLADAINAQAAAGQVQSVTLNAQRFDCGSVNGFLQAIMHVAQRDGLV
jgi:UTP--glucose-1-phosphate uridylyltransferase